MRTGVSTDITPLVAELEATNRFVVGGGGAIAVCAVFNELLIVSCRGTVFSSFYDWQLNFQAALVGDIRQVSRFGSRSGHIYEVYGKGKLHDGFRAESVRIVQELRLRLDEPDLAKVDRILFTGHSLGGAVASIVQSSFIGPRISRSNPDERKRYKTALCIFGAPRVADDDGIKYLYRRASKHNSLHVKRLGDMVPTVPPLKFGYANHPHDQYIENYPDEFYRERVVTSKSKSSWRKFFRRGFDDHKIDVYRKLLGKRSSSDKCHLELASYQKLVLKELQG